MAAMCSITVDRTGFPLVHAESLGLDVHLLPVTKVQFEAFLAEPNAFGDTWYEEVLQGNARCSWRGFCNTQRERLFITGVLPGEAEVFATWLGSGFRLPSITEWQSICGDWSRRVPSSNFLDGFLRRSGEGASHVIRALMSGRSATSLARRALMTEGVLEWVTSNGSWRMLGEPREQFCTQLFDWRTPVTPIDPSKRNPACGFRLVRTR